MNLKDHYHNIQLEAIEVLYQALRNKEDESISLSDAVVTWFTDGYAEKFREEFLKKEASLVD